jgi:hypothetical protein
VYPLDLMQQVVAHKTTIKFQDGKEVLDSISAPYQNVINMAENPIPTRITTYK